MAAIPSSGRASMTTSWAPFTLQIHPLIRTATMGVALYSDDCSQSVADDRPPRHLHAQPGREVLPYYHLESAADSGAGCLSAVPNQSGHLSSHGLDRARIAPFNNRGCGDNGEGPLDYETLHKMVSRKLLNSGQWEDGLFLSPQKLRDACTFCERFAGCPPGVVAHLNLEVSPSKRPLGQENTCVSSKEIINSIFQVMTLWFKESTPRIRCRDYRPCPNAADVASLRFGFAGMIVLYRLEDSKPITFVCCDETFPCLEWAEIATKAFRKGAKQWAKAGLTFKQVNRSEPAHFRVAFSLFPGDLDCSVVAQAFFPGTKQPEQRTLWVYLLAFHPYYRPYMAGYMGHEAGHIGGARHNFDEHFWPDGSEIPERRSVTMGTDNPRSVMNYHNDPAEFVVQSSDIKEMKDMRDYAEEKYEGYQIIKIEPEVQVYSQMASFESIAGYLREEA
ncbi:hypothetical protein F4802DRAFT_553164 [Xylaria palmicola]|nr:hypothetical protein F4802DRAFT_553164 [Xylaria palmicola]